MPKRRKGRGRKGEIGSLNRLDEILEQARVGQLRAYTEQRAVGLLVKDHLQIASVPHDSAEHSPASDLGANPFCVSKTLCR